MPHARSLNVAVISVLNRANHLASIVLGLALAAIAATAAHAQVTCESLTSFSFPNTTIGGATSMPGGAYVAPDTWHLSFTNLPPWCQVNATITPTADSSIGVQVWLPMQRYNGRFLGTGNGGYAGGFFQSELAQGINNGFAAANTDMGTAPYADGVSADGLAGHPEKWKDFGWRATHLMTQFAQALVQAFYGTAANKSYFAGCSTGGQQALMEAQRFPTDYDGILAGGPAYNRTHLHTVLISAYKATHQPATGFIPATKFDVVNQAVLAHCLGQANGPRTDTFLTDPRVCRFNPEVLQCPGNVDGPNCLTTDQVAAMKTYYRGSTNPSNGSIINPGNARGSETSDPLSLGFVLNESGNEPSFDSLFKWVFGLTWQWQNFDFNNDLATVDQVLAADLNATSTDLSAFRNRGGKLILYHGWADPLIPAIDTPNYYNAVAQTMYGGLAEQAVQQTQSFARLYMAPGVWHCGASVGGGPGPNSFGGMIQQPAPSFDPQHDLLSALTSWVEAGTAPGAVIATKYNNDNPLSGIQMQRPLCVFPDVAEYVGSGDTTQPSNFRCVSHGTNFNSLSAAHDFSGDGRTDVLWRHSGGDVATWFMDGGQIVSAGEPGAVPTVWTVVATGDFDGDGKSDIVWRSSTGDLAIWLMNGSQIASGISLGNISTAWTVAGTGDFDGDGKTDILWRSGNGDLAIWFMNGGQIASSVNLGNVPTVWTTVGVGDFNADGKADILWRSTGGDLSVWFMNGGNLSSGAPLGKVSTAWSVAAAGDFNSDGTSDILWSDSAGDLAVWFMKAGALDSGGSAGMLPAGWTVVQAGDFDGDGNSDLLLRDTGGNVAVWLMRGTHVLSSTSPGAVSTNWAVQSRNAN